MVLAFRNLLTSLGRSVRDSRARRGIWNEATARRFSEVQLLISKQVEDDFPGAKLRVGYGQHDQHWLEYAVAELDLTIRIYEFAAEAEAPNFSVHRECWDSPNPRSFVEAFSREVAAHVSA